MPDPMLNRLTFEDLLTLTARLAEVTAVGNLLQDKGFAPVFSLVPGQPARIALGALMPAFETPEGDLRLSWASTADLRDEFAARVMPQAQVMADMKTDFFASFKETDHVGAPMQAACALTDDVPAEQTDSAAVPPAAVHGPGNSGGGRDLSTQLPAATKLPLSALSDEADFDEDMGDPLPMRRLDPVPPAKPETRSRWTADEDDIAVKIARDMRRETPGITLSTVGVRVAKQLDRPLEGTIWRLKNSLRARIEAPDPVPIPFTPAPAVLPDAQAVPGPVVDAPAAPAVTSDIQYKLGTAGAAASPTIAHIMALPDKGGWTLDRDLTLLDSAVNGWAMADIGVDLGLDAKAVQARFDLLTGLDRDTKLRKFARADVLAALQQLVAAQAVW